MITVTFQDSHPLSFFSTADAGRGAAREIRERGFREFLISFPCGFEIEWTDPDLFLEPEDVVYFLTLPVPLDIVRPLFINWQTYRAILKTYNSTTDEHR
jgi:hypothetical protein